MNGRSAFNYKYFQLQFFIIYFKDDAEESILSFWNRREETRDQEMKETNDSGKMK